MKIERNVVNSVHEQSKIDFGSDYNIIYNSMFSNCQSLGIEQIQGLVDEHFNKKKMREWLTLIVKTFNKRQFIIDVHCDYLKEIKGLFKPFKKSFKVLKYTSTNGSNMALCVVQINVSKLK